MDMTQLVNKYDEGEIMLVDKPYGLTSFAMVKKLRWLTRAKKVGHAGTLDPLATGLLILCTGKFTKRIHEFQDLEKEYTGTFVLGSTTASFDLESEVIVSGDYSHLKEEEIQREVKSLTGPLSQIPPIFSAVKVDGVRSYKKARAGEAVEIKPKDITIHSFEIEAIDLPEVRFKIICSKGTYIRSVARDLGKALGCGAYLSSLRREAIGSYRVEQARSPEEWTQILRPSEST